MSRMDKTPVPGTQRLAKLQLPDERRCTDTSPGFGTRCCLVRGHLGTHKAPGEGWLREEDVEHGDS